MLNSMNGRTSDNEITEIVDRSFGNVLYACLFADDSDAFLDYSGDVCITHNSSVSNRQGTMIQL